MMIQLRLVPDWPTREQLHAAYDQFGTEGPDPELVYRAMITASPPPPDVIGALDMLVWRFAKPSSHNSRERKPQARDYYGRRWSCCCWTCLTRNCTLASMPRTATFTSPNSRAMPSTFCAERSSFKLELTASSRWRSST